MATVKFIINGTKRATVPIYARLSAGRGVDITVKSGIVVDPSRWSNATETIKQRIRTEDDEKLISKVKKLREHVEAERKDYYGDLTREWLQSVIDSFHNKKSADAKNLNDHISKFITDISSGDKKNSNNVNYANGTVRGLKGFQTVFHEYQGVYTKKREEARRKAKKDIREQKLIDFEDINIDFYVSFTKYLSDEGFALNTQGRFVKNLKMFMRKALQQKKHNNREFEQDVFKVISVDSFAIALDPDEITKIWKYDLSKPELKRMEMARDSFVAMCETAIRVSDRKNIIVREIEGGNYIEYTQQKTEKRVIAPASSRFMEIWEKYGNNLPAIHEVYINKYIKTIAFWCGIDQAETWTGNKFGKKFETTKKRYELISCHTARRSGATNWKRSEMPIEDISILLGHSTVKQTMTYLKIGPEEQAIRIAKKFNYGNLKVV